MKWQTKDGRGNGARISVRKETPIVKMFQAFLKNSDRAVQDATYQHNRNSMTTHLEEVLSNSLDADLSAIQPCKH